MGNSRERARKGRDRRKSWEGTCNYCSFTVRWVTVGAEQQRGWASHQWGLVNKISLEEGSEGSHYQNKELQCLGRHITVANERMDRNIAIRMWIKKTSVWSTVRNSATTINLWMGKSIEKSLGGAPGLGNRSDYLLQNNNNNVHTVFKSAHQPNTYCCCHLLRTNQIKPILVCEEHRTASCYF